MEEVSHVEFAVSRVRDIQAMLITLDEVVALGDGPGYTPAEVLRALNVRVYMPGWIAGKEVALKVTARANVLDHFVEILPSGDLTLQKLPGLRRFLRRFRLVSRTTG